MMRVYLVDGSDCPGWAIDTEKTHASRFLAELGHDVVSNPFTAEVIHFVWWNALLKWPSFFLRLKSRVIATASNQISSQTPDFEKAKKRVSLWIAPSRGQFSYFMKNGIVAAYQPPFVDSAIFHPSSIGKEEMCAKLRIPWDAIRGRIVLGSFQRDTLGSDLKTAKWQKDPARLIRLLSKLPHRDRWVLLLAGPRRHYIVGECRRLSIPFIVCGPQPIESVDDLWTNVQPPAVMSLLYNLVDCYLVTSISEGGPRGILEASSCKTPIYSSDVGLAADILSPRSICNSDDEFHQKLVEMIRGRSQDDALALAEENYDSVLRLCGKAAARTRWERIYRAIAAPRLKTGIDYGAEN